MQEINSIGISCDMGNSLAMDDCFIWIPSVSQYPNLLLTNPVGRCDKRPSISLGQHDQINNVSIWSLWSLTSPPLNGRSCIYIYIHTHAIMWYLNYDSILWVHWLPLTTPTRRCVPLLKPRRGWNSYSTCLGLSAKARDALQKMGFTLVIHGFSIMLGPEWGKS